MISIITVNWRFGSLLGLLLLSLIAISQLFDVILSRTGGFLVMGQKSTNVLLPNSINALSQIPVEYLQDSATGSECNNMFGLDYLYSFVNSAASYSTKKSPSDFTCLRQANSREGRTDSFCIGGPAEFHNVNNGSAMFSLQVDLLDEDALEKKELPSLLTFPLYMYDTGPSWLLQHHVTMNDKNVHISAGSNEPVAILVKREGEGNLWHCMQELFTLYATIDILRMTPNPGSKKGEPLLSEDDAAQAQVIILDDRFDGPYWDLWDAVAKGPVLRAADIEPGTRFKNIVLPIPGGASPFWQGNWNLFPCDHSELLSTFSHRIRKHFFGHTDAEFQDPDRPLVVTYSDRTEKRRLIGKEENLKRLQEKFPHVEIRRIDFATLSFTEQIDAVSGTDILVGVHGAGLTHSMFLPPDSTVVEIIPDGMGVQVYRNLAKLGGHRYFGCHAPMVPKEDETADWYSTDIELKGETFQELMEIAIKSMYNRGLRNLDVVNNTNT